MPIIINPYVLGAGGGGGFTPPSIGSASYLMWCEARLLSLSNDDPVSEFTNQIDGNHWTQTGGNRPTFKTNIVNGHAVLRFDGTDDYLTLGSDLLSGKSSAEVFIVIKVDNDPPGDAAQSGLWNLDNDGTNASHYPYTDGTLYDSWGSTGRKTAGDPTPSLASWRIYSVWSAAGDWECRIDGSTQHSTASNTFGSFADGTRSLGRSSGLFGDYYLDGDVAAFVLVDAKLDGADRTAIMTELETTYGL